MKIMKDIKDIIEQYFDDNISIEDLQREFFLRFMRNIEYVFGLKVGLCEYNKLRGVLALNHICEQKDIFNWAFHVTDYSHPSSPCIYITLHLGCYEEIGIYLVRKGNKVCIPVTERVFMQETKHYYINLAKRGINSSQIVFVNIESNTGFRKMIRYAQKGYSLLCYIDGNSGIGGMTRNDLKLEKIHFFNTTIHVRKGIEYLDRILNREIIPIYSCIEEISSQPQIVLLPSINKKQNGTLTEKIWNTFSRIIWQYYWQWEVWLYIDEFIVQSHSKVQSSGYVLNTHRYFPLIKSGVYYFYDKQTNNLIKVSQRLFKLLSNLEKYSICSYDKLLAYIPKETLVNDLLVKKIII